MSRTWDYTAASFILEPIHHKGWMSMLRAVIGHFTVVYLVAKPLIWSEAEGDLVVLETRI